VTQAAEEVGKGKSLWLSLSEGQAFPMLSIQMIQVGEQSGELEKCFTKSPMSLKMKWKPPSCA